MMIAIAKCWERKAHESAASCRLKCQIHLTDSIRATCLSFSFFFAPLLYIDVDSIIGIPTSKGYNDVLQ